MCGILGMAFQTGHTMGNSGEVRKIWKKLLIESNIRGSDATGSVFIDIRNAMVIKHHIPARTFVETNYYKEISKRRIVMGVGENEPIVIIGHTRMKTQGTPLNMHNNHPIIANNVIGVHNGHISNDSILFDLYKDKGVERRAQVDSEIIFRLIDHYVSNGKSMPDSIKEVSKLLMGGFACAAVHVEAPWVLWLFRCGGPIEVFRYPEKGLVIFASEKRFIENATEGFDLGRKASIPIENEQAVAINVKQNRQTRFVLEKRKFTAHFQYNI